jgi:hypothetical protein
LIFLKTALYDFGYISPMYWDYNSGDSSVEIAIVYWLYGRGSIPCTARFNRLHDVETSFGAHPASYPVGRRGYSSVDKSVEAWSWPLISI